MFVSRWQVTLTYFSTAAYNVSYAKEKKHVRDCSSVARRECKRVHNVTDWQRYNFDAQVVSTRRERKGEQHTGGIAVEKLRNLVSLRHEYKRAPLHF